MAFQIVNPIDHPDWDELVSKTKNSSFFHSSAWARTLVESYGYKPLYFVDFEESDLTMLIPFMEIDSYLTGKRGVSLPFSDECPPKAVNNEDLWRTVDVIRDYGSKAGWRYAEWRSNEYFPKGVPISEAFYVHDIDLRKAERQLFSQLGKANQRNIKKAIRENVSTEISQSLKSLISFYRLNCLTRKRHGLPPQPFAFFKSVFNNIISRDFGFIVSAFHSGKIIGSSIFFHFNSQAIYKYGASTMKYQHLRPNNLIMWDAIRWCRDRGFESLNLGRTEVENIGLLRYKRMWGASERALNYYRYDIRKNGYVSCLRRKDDFVKRFFPYLPVPILRFIGKIIYRHVG